VLRDKECAVVWKSIDTRKQMLWLGRGEPYPRSWALHMFFMLGDSAQSIPRIARIPSTERQTVGKRIREHALALRDELNAVRDEGGFLLRPFGEAAIAITDRCVAENWDDRDGNTDAKSAFLMGALAATNNICNTLEAVAAAADEWTCTKPGIVRPNNANAVRLYFMRTMTACFRESFDTPLRDAVAALTRSIYQCDMDAATVAKLAP
jgi:hypothetical protein